MIEKKAKNGGTYDWQSLRPARVTELASDAVRIAESFPTWTKAFATAVRREQGWPEPA